MRLTTLLLVCLLAACSNTSGPYPPVPAPRTDVQPLPPVSGEALAWQPGHWDWNGSGYAWAAGMYVPAAGHGMNWVREYWDRPNGQWEWQPAHWTGG